MKNSITLGDGLLLVLCISFLLSLNVLALIREMKNDTVAIMANCHGVR